MRKSFVKVGFVIAGILVLAGCSQNEVSQVTPVPIAKPAIKHTQKKILETSDMNDLVNSLTIQEKAAQMTGSLETLVPEEETYHYLEETVTRTVVFPGNIGLGVVGDKDSLYKMGEFVGKENRKAGAIVSFASVAATSFHPCWGGTFQCYSDDYKEVYSLGRSYVKGLVSTGIMPCLTGFINTGQGLSRENISLTEDEIRQQLFIFRQLLDAAKDENEEMPVAIQISSCSINGTKMVENKELLTDMLRNVMKFDGIILTKASDVELINKDSLAEKLASVINAGVDVISKPSKASDYTAAIVQAVKMGLLKEKRVNESVTRILTAKKALGLFSGKGVLQVSEELDENYANKLAASLVQKSLVLLKNEKELLPLKKGLTIYVTGPAADNLKAQCGGLLTEDNKDQTRKGSTILQGLQGLEKENMYTIVTDKKEAKNADVTLLCVGESAYTSENGDVETTSLTSEKGLYGNKEAIEEAKELGHKTITLLVAGRHLDINPYIDQWDSIVMCYLPGSKGDAIANVLAGEETFTGKLTMPWYNSEKEFTVDNILYGKGYGREY